jgi:homoserine kinase
VQVPASSANLGPGFDSLGLALGIHDVVSVEALPSGLEVEVAGEGAGQVPLDEGHLVVRALRAGLAHVGVVQPGLRLVCRNVIPHGRGLGSSASAVVAGLVAARALLAEPERLDDDALMNLAEGFEGHPDNVAASFLGGFTVSWVDGEPRQARAVRLEVHPDVVPVACVPATELATSKARAMLPAQVPHQDAAFNAGRAALLVEALTRRPELLLSATRDRLHQSQRAAAMPATLDLVCRVRAAGLPAVVSGAGPTVLVLATGAGAEARVAAVAGADWRLLTPGVDTQGTGVVAHSSILA